MNRIAILILLVCAVTVTDGKGLKILGGYLQNYDVTSSNFAGNTREWGSQDNDDAGTSILTVLECYCWNNILNERGYCYQKLIVSNSDNREEAHLQIEGSYQVMYDSGRSVILDTIHKYGIQYAEPPMQDIVVAEGETWNPVEGEWAYGYLHFIVNVTTRPSFTNTFSKQKHKSTNLQSTKQEAYIGQLSYSSLRTCIAEFRSWDRDWSENTLHFLYRWTFSISIVDALPDFEHAQTVTYKQVPGRSFVLENLDPTSSSMAFPEVSSSDLSFKNSARLSSAFGLSYTVNHPMWFEIPSRNYSELAASIYFTFSTASELERLVTEKVSLSTKWPSACPAATRVTYRISIIEEVQKLPVDFIFQTGEAKWIERKDIVATLKGIKVTSKSCCISETYTGYGECKFPRCI